MNNYERLRESYRPEGAGASTRVLMIGESRPANGTFFYCADSNLYRSTRQAFVRAYRAAPSGKAFLAHFQGEGFFLVDLCHEPVNRLDPQTRLEVRHSGEKGLTEEMKRLASGGQIVCVMKDIAGNVRRAIAASGRRDLKIDLELPFPGRWKRNVETYINGLTRFLVARGQGDTESRTQHADATDHTEKRLTLHEEIVAILRENGNRWMSTTEIAEEVNRRGRYRKRDESRITPYQVHGRTRRYSHVFERDGSRVRLKASVGSGNSPRGRK